MVKTLVGIQDQGCCQEVRLTKPKGLVHDMKGVGICYVGIVVKV